MKVRSAARRTSTGSGLKIDFYTLKKILKILRFGAPENASFAPESRESNDSRN